jgi:hypothetical protein
MERSSRGRLSCMADDLPESLAVLVQGLIGRGFGIAVDEGSEAASGNRLIELRAPARTGGAAVRLIKDRGLWNTEIYIGGQWAGTYEVLLALDDAPYRTRAESHAERSATTLAVVDRLSQEKPAIDAITQRLADYSREYWKRLGVSPAD